VSSQVSVAVRNCSDLYMVWIFEWVNGGAWPGDCVGLVARVKVG
jgi:hypothetical protein